MEAASKVVDQSSHSRPRLSSVSSMKSIGNVSSSSEPDLKGVESEEKERALSVPPLPLYALLAADKDTSGSGSATAGIVSCLLVTVFPTPILVSYQGSLSWMQLHNSSTALTSLSLIRGIGLATHATYESICSGEMNSKCSEPKG